MPAKSRRTAALLVALAAFAAVGISAGPAGARVAATNDQFCSVLSSNQGAGIDFDGLGAPEARLAAKVMRKAAKTGVPATLKADLAKLAAVYDRIAEGRAGGRGARRRAPEGAPPAVDALRQVRGRELHRHARYLTKPPSLVQATSPGPMQPPMSSVLNVPSAHGRLGFSCENTPEELSQPGTTHAWTIQVVVAM